IGDAAGRRRNDRSCGRGQRQCSGRSDRGLQTPAVTHSRRHHRLAHRRIAGVGYVRCRYQLLPHREEIFEGTRSVWSRIHRRLDRRRSRQRRLCARRRHYFSITGGAGFGHVGHLDGCVNRARHPAGSAFYDRRRSSLYGFCRSVAQPADVLRDWDSAGKTTRAHCPCPNRDPRADGSHSLFSGRLCDKELCFRHLDYGCARSVRPWWQRNGYPTVPMILGFILADLIEANFHRALGIGFGSYAVFFTRPISLVMIVLVVLFGARSWAMEVYHRRREGSRKTTEPLNVKSGEFYFGGAVTLILLIFLLSSFRYSSEVRLFPAIVSSAGLVLMAYWLLTTMSARKIKRPSSEDIHSAGGVPAVLGVGLLGVYALLVTAAGFIIASMIFFVLVMFLSSSRRENKRWRMVSVLTIAIGLFLLSCDRLLQVNLPTGLLW